MLPLFGCKHIHPFEHVAFKQFRKLSVVSLVRLDPATGFDRYKRARDNQFFDVVRCQFIGESETERTRLICYVHTATLVTLKKLLQQLLLARDTTVEDFFSLYPCGDLPTLFVHIDTHVDILTDH